MRTGPALGAREGLSSGGGSSGAYVQLPERTELLFRRVLASLQSHMAGAPKTRPAMPVTNRILMALRRAGVLALQPALDICVPYADDTATNDSLRGISILLQAIPSPRICVLPRTCWLFVKANEQGFKRARRCTNRHTDTQTHRHTGTHRHTQAHTHTQTHRHTDTQAHTGTHRHTRTDTHAHTHTTHSLSLSVHCAFCAWSSHPTQTSPSLPQPGTCLRPSLLQPTQLHSQQCFPSWCSTWQRRPDSLCFNASTPRRGESAHVSCRASLSLTLALHVRFFDTLCQHPFL